MSVVNLFIVGGVFSAPDSLPIITSTSTQISPSIIDIVTTSTLRDLKDTATPTLVPNHTDTQTPSSTPTYTLTHSATSTLFPSPTSCILWAYWPTYSVVWGDTLFSLARATGSTVEELMLANCLYNDHIYADQILYVPRLPIKPPTITPSIPPTETKIPSPTPCIPMKSWSTYRVQKGDTLDSIARRTHSVAWLLMQANCLNNEDIYVGQLLFVPILPNTTQAPAPGPIPTDTPFVTPTNTQSFYLKFSPSPVTPLFQIIN